MMVSKKGQGIRYKETDVRPMGRSAAGVRGIKLRSDDEVEAMDVLTEDTMDLLTIAAKGFGKRTRVREFPLQKRGGYGLRAMKVTSRTGDVVSAQLIQGDESDLVLASQHAQTIRTPLKSIKRLGRDTQGVTVMRLNSDDLVASVTLIPPGEEDAELALAEEASIKVEEAVKEAAANKGKSEEFADAAPTEVETEEEPTAENDEESK